tara:strand:+ start:299 stop:595 length:297 start_codon:yes stop_codon:yes gene_type:complete
MKVIVDLCIVPIGIGASLSKYISICENEIKKTKLKYILCPNGTSIEGEWDEVFEVIKKCHQKLHDINVPRIHTNIKIGTRIDKIQTLEDKINALDQYK